MNRGKYRSRRQGVYASRLEADYAFYLTVLQKQGEVADWYSQVPLWIGAKSIHRVDFLVFYRDGRIDWPETKGYDTELGRLKRKLACWFHGVKIRLVHREDLPAWIG